MDIYAILSSKPHNKHYLQRYIKFIDSCNQANLICAPEFFEIHHICPKAKDLFPEYDALSKNLWNSITLSFRQHFIAHWLLWKTFGGSQTTAFNMMMNFRTDDRVSSVYQKLRTQRIFDLTSRTLSEEHKKKIGDTNRGIIRTDAFKENLREIRTGSGNPMFGKPVSNDTRSLISSRIKDLPPVTCPHCGKTGGRAPMTRWHFDNCRKSTIC